MVKTENKIQKEPSKVMQQSLSSASNEKKKKYKGVRMRTWGSWVSEIRAPNQKTRIWLGSYSTAEAAARAYDAALLCLKGSSATNLNFPSSSSSLFIPQDTVMCPKSIQKIAAAAAANNSFVENSSNPLSPPPISTTSSSLVSSPSMSSSPYDQIDDDVSLFPIQSFGSNESMAMMMDSWFGFDSLQSPKHVDQMLNDGAFFDIDSTQVLLNDWYEEGDISLWNFC